MQPAHQCAGTLPFRSFDLLAPAQGPGFELVAQEIQLSDVPACGGICFQEKLAHGSTHTLKVFKVSVQPIESIVDDIASHIATWLCGFIGDHCRHGEMIVDVISNVGSVDGSDTGIDLIQDVPSVALVVSETKKAVVLFEMPLIIENIV